MAAVQSKVRLVARCAVVSLPKAVREAARLNVGDFVMCENVKVGRGDQRIVLSRVAGQPQAPAAEAPEAERRRKTAAARAPRVRMTGERRKAKATGTRKARTKAKPKPRARVRMTPKRKAKPARAHLRKGASKGTRKALAARKRR